MEILGVLSVLSVLVIVVLIIVFWLWDKSIERDAIRREQNYKQTSHIDYCYQVGSDGPIYHVKHPDGRETWTDDPQAAPRKTRPNARINKGLTMYTPSVQKMGGIVDEFGRVPTAKEAAAKFNARDWRHNGDDE